LLETLNQALMFVHSGVSQGEPLSVMGDRYIIRISGEDTSGAYAIFDFWIPPGHGSPPHVHHREDETFIVQQGELTFFIGTSRDRLVARPGSIIHAPKSVPHFFRNEGEVPVQALTIVTPAGFENFFREIGVKLDSLEALPVPPTDEQLSMMMTKAPDFGLEILAPPPWIPEQ
jgi:mannose-6-phosphate isomerase-like protein (cupin superfamily)